MSTMNGLPFELDSLSKAVQYQKWIYSSVQPFMGRRILEMGSGIGNLSQWLPLHERLILSEVESSLLPFLKDKIHQTFGTSTKVTVHHTDLNQDFYQTFLSEQLDTIVSFNVIEHIENDTDALTEWAHLLREGQKKEGDQAPYRLVSFVPAQPWAYGAIDKNYGHFRRYSVSDIQRISQKIAPDAKLYYRTFNAIGLLGWIWNGKIKNTALINPKMVNSFEKLVPVLRPIDDFLCKTLRYPFGQSIIWVLEWS